MSTLSRRELIAGLAASAGALPLLSPVETAGSPLATNSEYMFEPGLVYLNTAALGPTPRSILNRTIDAWSQIETDPVVTSYGEGSGQLATDRARAQIGALINCTANELLVTRSATMAMNSIALGTRLERGDRILTTDIEHEGGLNGWNYLHKSSGVDLDIVKIGHTDYDPTAIVSKFERAIRKETKVLMVSHVVSSTGLRMPVREIVTLAKSNGILTVIDGAQAVGCIDVDVAKIGCDVYVGTGHKWIMGPKGTGFAYISKAASELVHPVEWEQGRRYVSGSTGVGTLPLVVGLGEAAAAMKAKGMQTVEKRIISLRDRVYHGLSTIPRVTIYSPPPGPQATALIGFRIPDNMNGRDLQARLLQKYKIQVKVIPKIQYNGNRISPHIFNTENEIDNVITALKKELA